MYSFYYIAITGSWKVLSVIRLTTTVSFCSYSNWSPQVGPQSLWNGTFWWHFCIFTFPHWSVYWYWDFAKGLGQISSSFFCFQRLSGPGFQVKNKWSEPNYILKSGKKRSDYLVKRIITNKPSSKYSPVYSLHWDGQHIEGILWWDKITNAMVLFRI